MEWDIVLLQCPTVTDLNRLIFNDGRDQTV